MDSKQIKVLKKQLHKSGTFEVALIQHENGQVEWVDARGVEESLEELN